MQYHISGKRCADISDFQVDIKKVNLDVLRPWVARRIIHLLGVEDDIVIDTVFNLLEEPVRFDF